MKIKTFLVLFVLVPLIALAKPQVTEELEVPKGIEEQIEYYSTLYNVDSSLIKKVIECESDGDVSAVGDGGLSKGIGQFQKSTFLDLSNKMGEVLDYNSSHDQIKLMTWSIVNGYGRRWTAYRAIQNGGTYSFYSSQLKRHFTVSCR